MIKETTVSELKKIWNKYNDYSELDGLLKNLRENDGKEIKDWLHLPIHLPFIKKELKGLSKNAKVLEAGCGFGHWVFWMAEQGYQAVGVDLAPKAIITAKNYAKKNNLKNCEFIEGDIRKLPIKDNYFDIIFSFGVIEHFHNPEIILDELKRVLKPGGKIFFSVPNQYSFHTLTRIILKGIGKWHLGYERSYSSKSLNILFRKCGFEVLRGGIMPGGELFGRGMNNIPLIGDFLFKLFSKISFYIENHQKIFGFWLYGVAKK
ncbi:MAG: class I SAM-dependent methyltransferase [Candidatus Shapirobacteria bacterium]|nr:class I SAM-dependent methyltransferase [Candidatus Shapirobacteria bacterium]MDD4410527.1 class I SAM-dependent methyltransferase [Candidatus Shapirobacteria bacterium]